MQYATSLFRGWEVVRLNYSLEKDAVVMRRQRTWKGREEQRVELASLSGEVRRIRGRQPAFTFSTIALVLILLVLAIDGFYHGVGASGNASARVSWPLWAPLLILGACTWMVRFKTRKPAEWSHFVGRAKGTGLFILRDPRHPKAHEMFVAAVRQRLPET